MVMETPSPQCVGLEFVRQYYTVLNKAPMHLHRFYSHNSLFMHGGPNSVNDPTVGQSDIHKKIISLNFQDCHAKIRMVDAHATLGEGVVIQVTGELSNNGMPMRRFMQTFVLAPQSPKKYYVHNDIFRYQDEVFCEEEPVEEGISEPEEELESDGPCAVESTAYPSNSSTINGSAHHNHHEPELSPPIQVPASAASSSTHISSPSQTQVTPPPTSVPAPTLPPVPVTPPVAAPTPISSEPPRPPTPPAEEEDSWGTPGPASDEWADTMEENVVPSIAKKETPVKKENKSLPPVQPELPLPPPTIPAVVNEPKTFANLFKNSSSNFNQSLSSSSTQPTSQTHPEPSVVPQPSFSAQPPRTESSNNRSNSIASGPSPGSAQSSNYGGSNFRTNRNFYDEDKRRPAVPDSQQVFVGNLPHSIGEDELKSEFAQYGKVLEIRINTGKGKSGTKGPNGHQVPNFGFVAFDDEDSVTKCLNARPIYLNGESRINVEEKKARNRMDGMMGNTGGRPSSGRGGLGESGGGGGMRGGRGGMNQGRGGRGSYSRGDNNRGGPGGSRGGSFVPRR